MKGDSFTGKAAFPAPFMRSCPYQAIMLDGLLGFGCQSRIIIKQSLNLEKTKYDEKEQLVCSEFAPRRNLVRRWVCRYQS
jgi:hypothetical protein